MKKTFLLLTVVAATLFTSCSDDDSSSNNSGADFVSNILVDGVNFSPSEPTVPQSPTVVTSFTAGINNGDDNVRTFHMMKQVGMDINSSQSLQLSVIYPVGQTSINGTYQFAGDIPGPSYAQGSFTSGMTSYTLDAGSLTVTDLGNNKFKLVFNNVTASNFMNEDDTKTVTGYCEGTFELTDDEG